VILTINNSSSLLRCHFRKNKHKIGTRNKAAINAPNIANIFVYARGEKSFPSIPWSAKIGANESIIIKIANTKGLPTSRVASCIIVQRS